MTTRAVWFVLVGAMATSTFPLDAQPSTDRLVSVDQTRARFTIEVGGTAGPLSPFQRLRDSPNRLERLAMLSYRVGPNSGHAVRLVAMFYQAERKRVYEVNSPNQSTHRSRERLASVGAMVDMFETRVVGKERNAVNAVAALGGGVSPYASRRFEFEGQGYPTYVGDRRNAGVGVHVAGKIGLRWRWLSLDQQVMLLTGFGGRIVERNVLAPITMGVRF